MYYTNGEYKLLHDEYGVNEIKALYTIYSEDRYIARLTKEGYLKGNWYRTLYGPLEDIPLFINHFDERFCKIAAWRLFLGK